MRTRCVGSGVAGALVSASAGLGPLRRALAIDPARAITYLNLAEIYYRVGRNDRALAVADSAVALDSEGRLRMWRAWFRLAAGDTGGAVADARLVPGNVVSQ